MSVAAQVTNEALNAGAHPAVLALAQKMLGVKDYIGWCQSFVEKMGGTTSGASAIQAWQNAQNKVTGTQGMQPGDLVYFSPNQGNGQDGHTGIYCVDFETEILSTRGWLKYNEVKLSDKVASYNFDTDSLSWQKPSAINVFEYEGPMIKAGREQSFSMLVTPDHKVIWTIKHDKEHRLKRITKASEMFSQKKVGASRRKIPVAAKWEFKGKECTYEDGLRLGWFLSEGWWSHRNRKSPDLGLNQSLIVNYDKCKQIKKLFNDDNKYTITENSEYLNVYIKVKGHSFFAKWGKEKNPNLEILNKWSDEALKGCYEGLLNGDGDTSRNYKNARLFQKDGTIADFFQALCIRLGKRANIRPQRIHPGMITVYVHNKWLWADAGTPEIVKYKGIVWCPTTETGFWLARRNGSPFITGNSGNNQFISATDSGIMNNDLQNWQTATGQRLLGYVPQGARQAQNPTQNSTQTQQTQQPKPAPVSYNPIPLQNTQAPQATQSAPVAQGVSAQNPLSTQNPLAGNPLTKGIL